MLEQPRLKVYRRQGERVLIPPTRIRDSAPLPLPAPTPLRRASWAETAGGAQPRRGPARRRRASAAESLLLHLPVGVVVVDRRYDIQSINAAARRLLGIHGTAIGEDFVHLAPSGLTDGRCARRSTRRSAGEPGEIVVDVDDAGRPKATSSASIQIADPSHRRRRRRGYGWTRRSIVLDRRHVRGGRAGASWRQRSTRSAQTSSARPSAVARSRSQQRAARGEPGADERERRAPQRERRAARRERGGPGRDRGGRDAQRGAPGHERGARDAERGAPGDGRGAEHDERRPPGAQRRAPGNVDCPSIA